MAHFAEINRDNAVTRVVVISDSDCLDEDGNESEAKGIEFCRLVFGGGTWKQTSYNGKIRVHFAGAGSKYDEDGDYFYMPKSPDNPSFVWDDSTKSYTYPIAEPTTDRHLYRWDEDSVSWVLKDNPPTNKP